MNRLIIFVGLMSVLLGSMIYGYAYAQLYSGGKGEELTVTEAELAECKKLGIPEFECNQNTILAARKQIYAEANVDNPDRGSGTSMLATRVNDAVIFMGALVGIFGAISAAFFAMSRTKKPQ